MRRLLASSLLGLALPAAAQDYSTLPACEAWLAQPLPAEAEATARKGCDSDALLHDGRFAEARACAWAERAETEPEYGAIGGSATLLAIYANGHGVPRDYALARRMACESGFADAETEGRLERIAAMEAGTLTEPLDFCADITSGYMMGHCASRDAFFASREREKQWAALQSAWPAAHRAAWKPLRAAADAFFEARVQGEVDASGTGRGAFIVGETEALEIALLEHVRAFERGELPNGTPADLAAADRQLNAAYAKARAEAKWPEGEEEGLFGPLGTISPEGIRDAERAWIKYRDAWVAFGKLRYPSVSDAAWAHFFTLERERQLRELYEGV